MVAGCHGRSGANLLPILPRRLQGRADCVQTITPLMPESWWQQTKRTCLSYLELEGLEQAWSHLSKLGQERAGSCSSLSARLTALQTRLKLGMADPHSACWKGGLSSGFGVEAKLCSQLARPTVFMHEFRGHGLRIASVDIFQKCFCCCATC